MERKAYYFGTYLLVTLSLCLLLQNVLTMHYGIELVFRRSFLPWHMTIGILSLMCQAILLIFFESKKYWLPFTANILMILATLFSLTINYSTLQIQEYNQLSQIAHLGLLGTNLLLALSLIFSKAKENKYLKYAGLISLPFLLLPILARVFWGTNLIGLNASYLILDSSIVAGLAYSLVPLLFALSFRREVLALGHPEQEAGVQSKSPYLILNVITAAVVVFLGLNLFFSTEKRVAPDKTNFNAKQIAKKFHEREYIDGKGQSMEYQLLLPEHYDSTKKYPMVVALHSGAGWGTDNVKQFEGSWCADLLSEKENQVKYPAIIFVPQCPPWVQFGAVPAPFKSIDHLIFEAMDSLSREFSIDASRIYVSGASLGGYGSWHLISERPDLFAAAIPIEGGGNPRKASKIKDVAIWAFHGALDKNVPVRYSRDMIEAIKKEGGNPRYTEFEKVGHGLWAHIRGTPELLPWLFDQRKTQVPL